MRKLLSVTIATLISVTAFNVQARSQAFERELALMGACNDVGIYKARHQLAIRAAINNAIPEGVETKSTNINKAKSDFKEQYSKAQFDILCKELRVRWYER